MSAQELDRAVELFVRQVGHWQQPRWSAPATVGDSAAGAELAGGASRGDVVHRLVQEIADLAADAEGEPRREVPRIDNDLALPDQLRVVAADLVAAGASDDVLAAAAAKVTAVRRML
jgi:hypothetical protein